MQLRLYPRDAALARYANHIDASPPVGAELYEGSVGEGHPQNRGPWGHTTDLEFEDAAHIFASQVGPHLVQLLSGKRTSQDLDEGRDFLGGAHVDMKLRVARQLLAKFSQVADKFIGIAIPGISEELGGDMVVGIPQPIV
jgi:hypothetical protein